MTLNNHLAQAQAKEIAPMKSKMFIKQAKQSIKLIPSKERWGIRDFALF